MNRYLAASFLLFAAFFSNAQRLTVSGKVTEVTTGAAVPFANVVIQGTGIGTTTDFDGYYSIDLEGSYDSLTVSYIGFLPRTKPITAEATQVINFQLEENIVSLEDVDVYAGENPAFPPNSHPR